MNRLKLSLDYYSNKDLIIKKPDISNRRDTQKLLRMINGKYNSQITDPFINNYITSTERSKSLTITQETININRDINSLSDLIKLISDYPIISSVKYNINMEQLHKIKPHLIELDKMIGIIDVKNNIVDQILFYVQNLHLNSGIDFMHTVLYGPPGTGKTEIAKIIGKIFAKLGILKNNYFKKVTRTDLVAGYLGQTALKTTSVINAALGGVLFIDEAYALGNSEKRDSFAKECIDTLCEALSDHKENLMIIIAGYETELNDCFFSYNQGLKSRFPWIFKTEKYDPIELKQIFIKKVFDINWSIDDEINIEFFESNKDIFPHFGRDMEILLLKTKIAHSRRVFCKSIEFKTIINNTDIEHGLELFKKYINIENKREPNTYNMYS